MAAAPLKEISQAEVLGPGAATRGGDWEFEGRLPGGIAVSLIRGTPVSRVGDVTEGLRG